MSGPVRSIHIVPSIAIEASGPSYATDGWGAVVNEALMCGEPVLCSESCGSAALVRNSERSEIFRTGDVSDLARAISSRIANGRLTPRTRERIRWSRCIEGTAAAAYLVRISEHVEGQGERPVAPWLLRPPSAALARQR